MVYGLLQHRQVKFPQQPMSCRLGGVISLAAVACYSIDQKYRNYGGDIGMLGVPEGDAQRIGDHAEGQVRNYRSQFFSAAHPVTSVKQRKDAEAHPVRCHRIPPNRCSLRFTGARRAVRMWCRGKF